MFSLGIFLREYYDKIIRVYHLTKAKLLGLFVAGACLSLLQFRGTGIVEMPVGTLLEAIALMLLAVMVPTISKDSKLISGIISTFGVLSTYIYITHMLWLDVYSRYIKESVLHLGETTEAFLRCVVVIGITLITGILYLGMKSALQLLFSKIKQAGNTTSC